MLILLAFTKYRFKGLIGIETNSKRYKTGFKAFYLSSVCNGACWHLCF